ncbi:MAG: DUF2505 domain-containing protein [Polyangiales bacterium]
MNKFTMTHEFNCSVETYWNKLQFDDEVNNALYKKALGFPEYSLLEHKDSETEIFRRVSVTPKMDMPAAVQKVLGSNFRYTEETRYNKKAGTMSFKAIPSTLADKLTTTGVLRMEALGPNRCRRIIDVTTEAKVMLVGGVLESTAEKNVRDGYDKGARFFNQWIAEKGLDK